MSRTNPYKKKRRCASKTFLIFGEGFDEEMFLNHLHRLYSLNSGVNIKIRKGKGGTADKVVIDADKIPGAYDRKIVMLDNDKPGKEMTQARQEAKKRGIQLVENTPCLESVPLSILEKKPNSNDSNWCKKSLTQNLIKIKKTNLFI